MWPVGTKCSKLLIKSVASGINVWLKRRFRLDQTAKSFLTQNMETIVGLECDAAYVYDFYCDIHPYLYSNWLLY